MKARARRLTTAIVQFGFVKPWFLWIGLGIPVLLLIPACRYAAPGVLGDEAQAVAASLEVLGLLLLAHGFNRRLRDFDKPTLMKAIASYARSFLASVRGSRTHELRVSSGVFLSGIAGADLSASGTVSPSVEQRIEALEKVVTDLRGDLAAESRARTEALKGVQAQAAADRRRFEEELMKVRDLQEKAAEVSAPKAWLVAWLLLLAGQVVAIGGALGGVGRCVL